MIVFYIFQDVDVKFISAPKLYFVTNRRKVGRFKISSGIFAEAHFAFYDPWIKKFSILLLFYGQLTALSGSDVG